MYGCMVTLLACLTHFPSMDSPFKKFNTKRMFLVQSKLTFNFTDKNKSVIISICIKINQTNILCSSWMQHVFFELYSYIRVISEYKKRTIMLWTDQQWIYKCKMKSSPRYIYNSILLKTLWICLFLFFIFFSTYRPDFFEKKKSVNQLIKKNA